MEPVKWVMVKQGSEVIGFVQEGKFADQVKLYGAMLHVTVEPIDSDDVQADLTSAAFAFDDTTA